MTLPPPSETPGADHGDVGGIRQPASPAGSARPSSSPPAPTAPAPAAPAPRGGASARHTRRVNQAKVVLPTLAGLTIAAIALWPLIKETTNPRPADPGTGQLEMLDAHFLGTDKTDRPVEVRADRAMQESNQDNLIDLVSPEAEITLKNGQWVTLNGDTGRYDKQSGHLTLEGRVTLFHDHGYEFTTDKAEVDTSKNIAWGNARVAGQGPFGDIDAGGFRMTDKGSTIVFTGKARLRLVEKDRHTDAAPSGPGAMPRIPAPPTLSTPAPSTPSAEPSRTGGKQP
ncbi:LPS export ABC transporter periplasmic protein LptC [Nitrospirillum pindoramense]|uniref:Lipopolysaccharide export system protein LptC n=1 Tax=Nitrospirillum amazonense TaxID=28077 RepID=A0A560H649_9PROT|nr:LPS export ABC transporter periplasmic protein LptC [Nitrospirillum amazonense]TWB41785.1 lipopolysaccharide export system protein LptC [Nitrospirillum amazonense]